MATFILTPDNGPDEGLNTVVVTVDPADFGDDLETFIGLDLVLVYIDGVLCTLPYTYLSPTTFEVVIPGPHVPATVEAQLWRDTGD